MWPAESVNEGHPDKLCDQVSDAILDACLEQDPDSKVACETATKTNMVRTRALHLSKQQPEAVKRPQPLPEAAAAAATECGPAAPWTVVVPGAQFYSSLT